MYRIDNITAVPAMPTPDPVGPNPNGYFYKGDPTTGTLATIVDDHFLNVLQEEICNVIADASITLSKTTYNQLLLAIRNIAQRISPIYGTTSSSPNTYSATLSPAPTSYYSGQFILLKFTNGNTSAATINLNSLGAKNIVLPGGAALSRDDILSGMVAGLIYDGTNFQLISPSRKIYYGTSSSAANTYTSTISGISGYYAGLRVAIQIDNENTGASTINVNGLGAKAIRYPDNQALLGQEIAPNMVTDMMYDGVVFKLISPPLNRWLSYTPTIDRQVGPAGTTPTYTVKKGRYCKIGRVVHLDVLCENLSGGGTAGAGAGYLTVSLPIQKDTSGDSNHSFMPIPCGSAFNGQNPDFNDVPASLLFVDLASLSDRVSLRIFDPIAASIKYFSGSLQDQSVRGFRIKFTYESTD